jgi:hypothetical protein
VWREPVISTMPGQERHSPVLNLGHGDRVGRLPVWRVNPVFFGIGKQRVQPGAANDGEVGDDGHVQTLTGTGSAGYGAVMAFSSIGRGLADPPSHIGGRG